MSSNRKLRLLFRVALVLSAPALFAQEASQLAGGVAAPLTVTMQDALSRARANEPQFHAALTESGVAHENAVQSRAALLPGVNYNAAYLYTQGNGTSTGRFVGANGVHEYISQGTAQQSLSLLGIAEYRRARPEQALAKAKYEIASRGLVSTIVAAYYGSVVAQRKYSTAQRAEGEAERFFDITQKLERGGEVAHSDTIKAQLQLQQLQRTLQDA